MNKSLKLKVMRDTLPAIKPGDYEFAWTTNGLVCIRNRKGEIKNYSLDALNQMSRSTGLPLAVSGMAGEALAWVMENEDSMPSFIRRNNHEQPTPRW